MGNKNFNSKISCTCMWQHHSRSSRVRAAWNSTEKLAATKTTSIYEVLMVLLAKAFVHERLLHHLHLLALADMLTVIQDPEDHLSVWSSFKLTLQMRTSGKLSQEQSTQNGSRAHRAYYFHTINLHCRKFYCMWDDVGPNAPLGTWYRCACSSRLTELLVWVIAPLPMLNLCSWIPPCWGHSGWGVGASVHSRPMWSDSRQYWLPLPLLCAKKVTLYNEELSLDQSPYRGVGDSMLAKHGVMLTLPFWQWLSGKPANIAHCLSATMPAIFGNTEYVWCLSPFVAVLAGLWWYCCYHTNTTLLQYYPAKVLLCHKIPHSTSQGLVVNPFLE